MRSARCGDNTPGSTFNLEVERGSGLSDVFPTCTDFSSAASIYNGDLSAFGTDWATGVNAKGSAWAKDDTVDYRFTVTVAPHRLQARTASFGCDP